MNNIEFKVGDIVTYKPYEKDIAAIVKEVNIKNPLLVDDERIFYRLEGNANAITSGLCIKESKYFKPYEE